MENNHILIVKIKDEKWLIHKITGVMYRNSLNIISSWVFVDDDSWNFFLRAEITWSLNKEQIKDELKEILWNGVKVKLNSTWKKDIVILATKEIHCLWDLLISHYRWELNANIKAIIANHNDLEEIASKFDIPFHYVATENIWRLEHEDKILEKINLYTPDLVVLAKYMRILEGSILEKYNRKIVNIHHSFLPAFIWANPYKQAYNRWVKIIWATAHIVTKDLDEWPIIFQWVKEIDHTYNSWRKLQKEWKNIEKYVLSKALNLMLEDRVFIEWNKTIIL